MELNSIKGAVHFVGIGGIGMSALARLLLAAGKEVSGSDKEANQITNELASLGASIHIGHRAENVVAAGLIVVSTAITDSNPELQEARKRALPVVHRSGILSCLSQGRKVIAVSGTHGKTTTTGMVSEILLQSGHDPSVVVGGIFPRIGSNARAGKGEYFIAEADESDRTHATMGSDIAIVTNIEADHMENYPGGMQQILENMLSFANHSKTAVVICLDDPGCQSIIPKLRTKVVTYGKSPQSDFVLVDDNAGKFAVTHDGKTVRDIELPIPGEHNRLNAVAAIASAVVSGIPLEKAAAGLSEFRGVARRFQVLGTKNGITVVDDYGHHPTEVKATLEAAHQYAKRQGGKSRIVAVFQPHQPGRLRDLWNEFCDSFKLADLALVTDIYVARGGQIEGITAERFVGEVKHDNAHFVAGKTADLPQQLKPYLQPGDIVLTIGAGDITKVGPQLLDLL